MKHAISKRIREAENERLGTRDNTLPGTLPPPRRAYRTGPHRTQPFHVRFDAPFGLNWRCFYPPVLQQNGTAQPADFTRGKRGQNMSTQPSQAYRFDGFLVRPITEQDRPYLELQIQADDYHREKVDADFFLHPQPGETSWALEDEDGRIVFYFKNVPVVRMHIQFTAGRRRATLFGLVRGLAWIEGIFRAARFREIIFDVDNPELEIFAKRHLGFVAQPNLLSRLIPTSETPQMQLRAVGTVPTGTLGKAG